MPKRLLSILSWLTWTLLTWAAVCAALQGFSKTPDIRMWWWAEIILAPAAALILGWRALRARASLGRWAGFLFWFVGAPLVLLLVLNYRYEFHTLKHSYDKHLLMLSCALAGLALILAALMQRRSREAKALGWGTLLDLAGGVACLALLVAAADFIWTKVYIEPLQKKTMQRWAELGRPMDEFEKTLKPTVENESLRALTQDLKPFGVITLYKTGSGEGDRKIKAQNTTTDKMPREVLDYLGSDKPEGEPISLPAKVSASLDAKADDFNRFYSGVLQREAPVWGIDPWEGYSIVVPNYLTARVLAQWTAVDAYHRLEKGDIKGAADAVAVQKKILKDFGSQPVLVSQMIKVAIDCLMMGVEARLPEDPEAMKQLAADVEAERAQFQKITQVEAWAALRMLKDENQRKTLSELLAHDQLFPGWMQDYVVPVWQRCYYQTDSCRAALYDAETVEISARAPQLVSGDLGASEMEQAASRYPSILTPNSSRAWLRLNCGLLLREQAQMIRFARARMQEGKTGPLGELQSVVIPGSKWVITTDANNVTASAFTMKLTPLPKWAAKNEVVDDHFWLIPLDGTKPWQIQQAANKSGGQ